MRFSTKTQAWYDAGAGSYFAPPSTLFAIQLFLFAWVEGRRMQDYNKPGMPSVIRLLMFPFNLASIAVEYFACIVIEPYNWCRLGQPGPHLL